MTSNESNGTAPGDLAFNRVLEAEARARERIDACRLEAASLIKTAEERARRIGERTDARLLKAHRLADASVERALGSLPRTAEAGGDPDGRALARLERAVAALADEIIGLTAPGADSGTGGDGS
ncbi:hypothetical protein [Thiocystis violacea]|uniref:hypothetical protein n=1 Tax=Thiocystis violacea TaxID=13725 RepID=UPI0019071D80|nr:hypothetical protein [Thiocystis violacea]MBK1719623.1 hypothetical protein [Thiocystis violacea]